MNTQELLINRKVAEDRKKVAQALREVAKQLEKPAISLKDRRYAYIGEDGVTYIIDVNSKPVVPPLNPELRRMLGFAPEDD